MKPFMCYGCYIAGKRLKLMEQYGLTKNIVKLRIQSGWDVYKAVSTPVRKRNQLVTREQREIAAKNGISPSCLKNRVYKIGWDVEKAITTPMNPQGKKFTRGEWK